ncbi:hypothetical protein PV08_11261 [Exophiala spinifera]|uniref:Nicotinamide N-methyltransferase n=1 Tax=Exophiala spinifera TaxID=91928 RepID=A0A0D2BFZ9_9EURO|nr:uncharacterized protein PV08_11261 [Exophiala spinifera]KIW10299.1 hypothetical protein PV08_11261 [Exophiala spinifera]
MYPSRVYAPVPAVPSAEDLFSSALSNLFTDDTQTHHGVPGQSVYYDSPHFGRLSLRIPEHPDAAEGRSLFAYNLWNGGVVAADAIEEGSNGPLPPSQSGTGQDTHEENHATWNNRYWSVRGKSVLELGAGAALPSIIAALSGAKSVAITDHPTSTALTMGAIEQSIGHNLHVISTSSEEPGTDTATPITDKTTLDDVASHTAARYTYTRRQEQQQSQAEEASSSSSSTKRKTDTEISIYGYTWGTTTFYLPNTYGKPTPDQPGSFQRIIIAECLWMPDQHVNICKTILSYLSGDDAEGDPSCALVVAGFHTGREILRQFFEVATGEFTLAAQNEEKAAAADDDDDDDDTETRAVRGRLKAVDMFEIDVNGVRRPWASKRPGEDKHMAMRWCVCAVLVRR